MSDNSLEILRQVNEHLRQALTRFRPEENLCLTIQPQGFSDLLAAVLRGGECLLKFPLEGQQTDGSKRECAEYRRNLELLKQFLPYVHGRLLAEKARLEDTQGHLAAAAAWARSFSRDPR